MVFALGLLTYLFALRDLEGPCTPTDSGTAVSPAFCRSQFGLALRREQSPPNVCCSVAFGTLRASSSTCLFLHPSRDAAPFARARAQYPVLSQLHNGRLTPVVRAARLLSPKIAPLSERTTARTRATSPLANWFAPALRPQTFTATAALCVSFVFSSCPCQRCNCRALSG